MAIEFVAILFLAMQWTAHLLSKCVPGFHVCICMDYCTLCWLWGPGPVWASGIERIDPICFLAGRCKWRLNQAQSVPCLIQGFCWMWFLWTRAMLIVFAVYCICCVFCPLYSCSGLVVSTWQVSGFWGHL